MELLEIFVSVLYGDGSHLGMNILFPTQTLSSLLFATSIMTLFELQQVRLGLSLIDSLDTVIYQSGLQFDQPQRTQFRLEFSRSLGFIFTRFLERRYLHFNHARDIQKPVGFQRQVQTSPKVALEAHREKYSWHSAREHGRGL